MSGSYDDRDGKIWMNGKLVEWRDANVHILTHAMHYASSVFEGERAYGGKIFKSVLHSERLLKSAKMVDFEIPYSCLLYTSPSPRDGLLSRMPSSA